MDHPNRPAAEHAWHIAQRWQQFDGELRANLLRIAAVGVFYCLHCWNYLGAQGKLPAWLSSPTLDKLSALAALGKADFVVDKRFHLLATLLALAWILVAAAVHLCLRNRVFPRGLSATVAAFDLVLLTAVLCISNGPRSPVVAAYFLVIVLSGLRFDLRLVRLTTVGAALGYLCVLGMAKWPATFGRPADLDVRVPRYHQLVTLAAIVLCGIFVGQIVRQVRIAAEEYAERRNKERA